MRRAYGVLPWGLVLLGLVHMAATFKAYDTLDMRALWFFNGGVALVVTGLLNLVNRAHGRDARYLRWLCRGLNVVTLCFSTLAGIVSRAGPVSLAFVVGLLGALTVLSFVPRSLSGAPRA